VTFRVYCYSGQTLRFLIRTEVHAVPLKRRFNFISPLVKSAQ